MQIKHESLSTIKEARLVRVHENDIEDGIFNCPDNVELIEEKAFAHHTQLIIIVNLNKVKRIEKQTFRRCSNLTIVNAPQVEHIGCGAFSCCSKLIHVDLPKIKTIEKGIFYDCTALTSLNVPQAISLKYRALGSCSQLAAINLPNVLTIGGSVFEDCIALTIINAPQIEHLGTDAFLNCDKLVRLNLSKKKDIGVDIFYHCIQLIALILDPVVRLDFSKGKLEDLQVPFKNLYPIIINNVDNPALNKDTFISQLPIQLKHIQVVLASELIENLCYIKEALKQHIAVSDIETRISSFYHQLPFFPRVPPVPSILQEPSIPLEVFSDEAPLFL